ncbi:MAG: AAA family ATPase [Succinimonas sp.]|nr:AAA family ATPase [Succinimonas sp.]
MTDNMPSLLNNPFGHISFDEFQQDKVAFADKTGFIEGLDTKSMSRFSLLLRPRCFGKSAFIMMLKCFYECGAESHTVF